MTDPRLLIISHVLPFPGASGQQLRVRHIVEAAVRRFQVDFLTYAPAVRNKEVEESLARLGCRPVILRSLSEQGWPGRVIQSLKSGLFSSYTGLKHSNFLIGECEFYTDRIRTAVNPANYDLVLYEYFHAFNSVKLFQNAGVPAVLDTHNVLWKSLEQEMSTRRFLPKPLKDYRVLRYRHQEELAWRQFDGAIAINRREEEMIRKCLSQEKRIFYAPMGTNLSRWPYSWRPAVPIRLGYYGGLGSAPNEAAARLCHDRIMPQIWKRFPTAELWLIGSHPSKALQSLASDSRIKVTGFVEAVQDILSTMSLVLCPWSGTYGFRSRIVEVMALGVPVVATPDAVDGMELTSGKGIKLVETEGDMTASTLELLSAPRRLTEQSRFARSEMDRLYSLESTYGRLMLELRKWLKDKQQSLASRSLSTCA